MITEQVFHYKELFPEVKPPAQEPLKQPPVLDLELLFVRKLNCPDQVIKIPEFYRKAALVFRLRKEESRVLLARLVSRGLASRTEKTVTFYEEQEEEKGI